MLIFLDFVWKLLNDEPTLKSRICAFLFVCREQKVSPPFKGRDRGEVCNLMIYNHFHSTHTPPLHQGRG